MITDADVRKLKTVFFVTKEDFKSTLRTEFKKQLKNYPTRDDLATVVAKLATKVELQEVKNDVADMRVSVDKILSAVDRISKTLEEWEYPAFKADVTRHDREIKKLAVKTGTAL